MGWEQIIWKERNGTLVSSWGNQTFRGWVEEEKLAKEPEGEGPGMWGECDVKGNKRGVFREETARCVECCWQSQWMRTEDFLLRWQIQGGWPPCQKQSRWGGGNRSQVGMGCSGGGDEEGEVERWRNSAAKGSREITFCLSPWHMQDVSFWSHYNTFFSTAENIGGINWPNSNIYKTRCELGELFF